VTKLLEARFGVPNEELASGTWLVFIAVWLKGLVREKQNLSLRLRLGCFCRQHSLMLCRVGIGNLHKIPDTPSGLTNCWQPIRCWPPSICSRLNSRKSDSHHQFEKVHSDGADGTEWLSTANSLPLSSSLNASRNTCAASSPQPSAASILLSSKASITRSRSSST